MRSSDSKSSVYIHGSAPEEQARLSELNQLMNEAALRELAIPVGISILDVGSGLGQLTRAMARATGRGPKVVGLERDPLQLSKARTLADEAGESSLIEFRQGDATDLPMAATEWGAFDLAHARFILEHVTDPLAVVRQMAQTIRRGGRVVLQDDDHDVLRLWPEPGGFVAVWQAYIESYRRVGNDPFVGRRLVELLLQGGLRPLRNIWIFFGSCAGQQNFMGLAENLILILRGAMKSIVDRELVSTEAFEDALAQLDQWKSRSDAAFWYAICYVEGIK